MPQQGDAGNLAGLTFARRQRADEQPAGSWPGQGDGIERVALGGEADVFGVNGWSASSLNPPPLPLRVGPSP